MKYKRKRKIRHQNSSVRKYSLGSILQALNIAFYVVLTIFGLFLNSRIRQQNEEFQTKIESTKNELLQSQLFLQKNQIAASLIDYLINGDENEKLLSMSMLYTVDDSLAIDIFKVLAINDRSIEIRIKALETLGRSGVADAKNILQFAKENAASARERQVAQEAESEFVKVNQRKFEENLSAAKKFYNIERWDIAVNYFNKALKYIEQDKLNKADLLVAQNYLNSGLYEKAAKQFNKLLINF